MINSQLLQESILATLHWDKFMEETQLAIHLNLPLPLVHNTLVELHKKQKVCLRHSFRRTILWRLWKKYP